MKVRTNELRHC